MNPSITTDHSDPCIKVCNGLLRGELSAVETYSQAIEKFPGSAVVETLREIRSEHSLSASRLSSNVRDMGGEPEKNSGPWGIFATAIQGTANLFGAGSAMESLKKGEEAGHKDYLAALLNDDVMEDCKNMIRNELMPPLMNHIATLDNLEEAV